MMVENSGDAVLGEAVGEFFGFFVAGWVVVTGAEDEEGWFFAGDMPEGGSVDIYRVVGSQHRVDAEADEVLEFFQRVWVDEAVDAANGDDSADVFLGEFFSFQEFGVGCQQ